MKARVRFCLGTRGTSTLEFAVVGAVFISLVLFTMEVCWQMTIDLALNYGARAASRFGMTGAPVPAGMTPGPSSRSDAILRLVVGSTGGILLAGRLQLNETAYPSFAAVGIATSATPGAGGPGQIVRYSLSYSQPFITLMPSLFVGSSAAVHHATVVVLNEPYATP